MGKHRIIEHGPARDNECEALVLKADRQPYKAGYFLVFANSSLFFRKFSAASCKIQKTNQSKKELSAMSENVKQGEELFDKLSQEKKKRKHRKI